jgi:hypothetical protein
MIFLLVVLGARLTLGRGGVRIARRVGENGGSDRHMGDWSCGGFERIL